MLEKNGNEKEERKRSNILSNNGRTFFKINEAQTTISRINTKKIKTYAYHIQNTESEREEKT